MDVVSSGSLRVASLRWQPRPGAWVLTVVCKATYVLRPGECTLAPAQDPLAEEDRHVDDNPARSLRVPRDLVPAKPGADVVLVGSVFAPERRPARAVDARLSVGEIDKTIEAVVDRTLRQDGSVREGPPFLTAPLLYERAAGGAGTGNPVGVRRDTRDAEGGIVLPNLQRPGASLANVWEPVGFGPIAPSWPERRERLRAVSGELSLRELGQRPLPEGMDLAFFNAAPRDQQLRALEGNVRLSLRNLHPEHPDLVTSVPVTPPRAVMEGRREGPVPITLRADTLWIDTDRALCTVTYRGMLPLLSADERGRVVVSPEGGRGALESSVALSPAGIARPAQRFDITSDLPLEVRMGAKAALPFAPTPAAPAAGVIAARPPEPIANVSADPPGGAGAGPASSPWASGGAVPVAPVLSSFPRSAAPAPSVYESSNAASGGRPAALPDPVRAAESAASPAPAPSAPDAVSEVIELVWFDGDAVPRIRRKAEWRPILDAVEQSPLDLEVDDPAFAKNPADVEDRREVFEILVRGTPVGAGTLDATLARCQGADGRFVPALALLAGELELPFDELATLKATLTTAAPLAGSDEALKGALQAAKDFLAIPGLMTSPAVADGLTRRIEEAFNAGKRVVPAGYLEAQRERALLENRQYQRRAVLGAKHLRGLLRLDGEAAPVKQGPAGKAGTTAAPPLPLYLPEALADVVPMLPRFRVRVVAELRLAADRYEGHPAAARAMALARLAPPAKS